MIHLGNQKQDQFLEENEIDINAKGVLPIIKSILHSDNLEIVSNKEWLSKLTISEMMNLASSTTLAQMLESVKIFQKDTILKIQYHYSNSFIRCFKAMIP